MKRMTKIITYLLSVLVLSCSFGNVAMAANGVSIVQDADMRFVTIPTTYEVETMLRICSWINRIICTWQTPVITVF